MAIRTPRPPSADEPTLIGGLIGTFRQEKERQRTRALEDRALQRREGFEDQQAEIQRQTFLRNVRGEEVVGGRFLEGSEGERPSLQPRDQIGRGRDAELPSGLEPRGSMLTEEPAPEVRPGAVGRAARMRSREFQRRDPLQSRAPQGPQFQETGVRKLDPRRDPTILDRSVPEVPTPEFDFSSFETQHKLPTGSLTQAFKENPVGVLNWMNSDEARAARGGGAPDIDLDDIRLAVNTRVEAIKSQMEFLLEGDDPRIEQLRFDLAEELDQITVGLIQAAIGDGPVTQEAAADEIDRLFPDESEEERGIRLITVMRKAGEAGEFAGRVRGALEGR